jgi:hypothetical protein
VRLIDWDFLAAPLILCPLGASFAAHWHTFQILTKRLERMRDVLKSGKFPVDNVGWALRSKASMLRSASIFCPKLQHKSGLFRLNR